MRLGSRRAGDYGAFASSSRAATVKINDRIDDIQTTLEKNKAARIVVSTGIDLLAASSPPIGTLVATYRMSKAVYGIATEANKAYQKTGDPNAAVKTAAKQVLRTAIGEARGEVINNMVDIGWTAMKASANIGTNEAQDRILSTAMKNTLDEVLPK